MYDARCRNLLPQRHLQGFGMTPGQVCAVGVQVFPLRNLPRPDLCNTPPASLANTFMCPTFMCSSQRFWVRSHRPSCCSMA